MLELFFAVLLALAVRDVFHELLNAYRNYRNRKAIGILLDELEDLEADDD